MSQATRGVIASGDLKAVADVVLAVGRHRHVGGDDEGVVTGSRHAVDERLDAFSDAGEIGLIPGLRVFPAHVLQRDQRRGAQNHRHVGRGSRARQHDVAAIGAQRGRAHRRDPERRRIGLAEQGRGLVAAGDVVQHARHEAVSSKDYGCRGPKRRSRPRPRCSHREISESGAAPSVRNRPARDSASGRAERRFGHESRLPVAERSGSWICRARRRFLFSGCLFKNHARVLYRLAGGAPNLLVLMDWLSSPSIFRASFSTVSDFLSKLSISSRIEITVGSSSPPYLSLANPPERSWSCRAHGRRN